MLLMFPLMIFHSCSSDFVIYLSVLIIISSLLLCSLAKHLVLDSQDIFGKICPNRKTKCYLNLNLNFPISQFLNRYPQNYVLHKRTVCQKIQRIVFET